jgi:hypothetical protein
MLNLTKCSLPDFQITKKAFLIVAKKEPKSSSCGSQ